MTGRRVISGDTSARGIVTLTSVEAVRGYIEERRARGLTIGFVPTMGYLHAGHRSLMERARDENDVVVVSIYVNPLQFGPAEDLTSYPRDLAADTHLCAEAGADAAFAPPVEEMHPDESATTVSVSGVADPLEGVSRPTHFSGVATVVAKLFGIVGACSAYFGEKDFQQLVVIRRMVHDLSMPVRVVGCAIVREPDGLAMSSRNVYLSAAERVQAAVLRRALDVGVELVEEGETDAAVVEAAMAAEIDRADLATIDYVAAVPSATLVADGPLRGDIRLLVAVRFESARLIDNAGCRARG